jgi:hypothetical protein
MLNTPAFVRVNFQRGQEAVAGDASIAMFGNTNQPIDVMVQIGHLFVPMPDLIRDDTASSTICTSTSRARKSSTGTSRWAAFRRAQRTM